MFENEVLEVEEINEKYNPIAVKGIDGIKPLWTLWLSMMLWFTQNPESFLITFADGKQLKLINSKNVVIKSNFSEEKGNMILGIVFITIIFLIIYWLIQTMTYRNSYYY